MLESILTHRHLPENLAARYAHLAQVSGRTPDVLVREALEHYIEREEWKLEEVDAVSAEMDAGTLETVSSEDLIGRLMAEGKISQASLNEAYRARGLPEDAPAPNGTRTQRSK
jgi:predicted transcriptional regulator